MQPDCPILRHRGPGRDQIIEIVRLWGRSVNASGAERFSARHQARGASDLERLSSANNWQAFTDESLCSETVASIRGMWRLSTHGCVTDKLSR